MTKQRLLSDSTEAPASAQQIDLVSRLLEELTFESGREHSRSLVRESFERAASGISGPLSRTWCPLIHETCEGLGIRHRPIDCSADQVVDLAVNGAQIVTYLASSGWLAITPRQNGRLLVVRPGDQTSSASMSSGKLRSVLSKLGLNGTTRCVVLEPGLQVESPSVSVNPEPLKRLWWLLRPEWPDIWIVIVFALVIGLLTLATPIAVETLVNTVAFGRLLQPVVILSLMLLTFLAFSGAIRGLQTYVVEIIQRRLFARVAADLAYRLPRVRPESLDGRSGRELVNRFFDVVVVQKVAAQLLLDGLLLVLGTLIGMSLLAFYHPWLLGFDIMLLGMIALIVFVLGRGAVRSSIKESKTKYRMAAWLEEIAGCPTTFRYGGAARLALENADRLTSDYLTARGKHFRILMRQILFALAMQAFASTVLLGLGGWLVISGQLTLGQLVAAELIVAVIVGSFAKLGKHMESFYDLLASIDKLGLLLDLPLERQDGLISLPSEARDVVELTGVEYCRPDGQPVLSDLNLTIQPGDRIAITGPASSGKSALLDILFGLRSPTRGHVTMRGVELRELRPDALRRRVALVRESEVFVGSVAENVRLGRPNASMDDVRKALADVGLLEDVLRFQQRLDTQLAGSGHPLTSTQLRRLMLARGCAGKPSLLLIDGTLDLLPDREALALVQWLCRPEHPWSLVLVTGREALAAACNRRLDLRRVSSSSESQQRTEKEEDDD